MLKVLKIFQTKFLRTKTKQLKILYDLQFNNDCEFLIKFKNFFLEKYFFIFTLSKTKKSQIKKCSAVNHVLKDNVLF